MGTAFSLDVYLVVEPVVFHQFCQSRRIEGFPSLPFLQYLFQCLKELIVEFFTSIVRFVSDYLSFKAVVNGHSCLVPDFRGSALTSHSIILAVALLYVAFILDNMLCLFQLLQKFYHGSRLNFLKCLFCIYLNDHVISVHKSIFTYLYKFINLCALKQSPVLGKKSIWSCHIIF